MPTYWPPVAQPHPAALPNLKKISAFLVENNYISRHNTTSAYAISRGTGISYNQVLKLIKRPGFVYALFESKVSGIFYDFENFPPEYPDTYPGSGPWLKEVETSVAGSTTVAGVALSVARNGAARNGAEAGPMEVIPTGMGIDKVARQLIKDGEFIAKTFEQGPSSYTNMEEFVVQGIVPILNAAISGARTPEQIAGVFHGITVALQNKTIVIGE